MKNNKIVPNEYAECCVFAQWLRLKNLLFSHIANENAMSGLFRQAAGGSPQLWGILRKQKEMGKVPGVPDYMILIPGGPIVFVEMKRVSGGTVSPEQRQWFDALNNQSGAVAFICAGADEAIACVNKLLK
jgi:hypothetical protein